MRFTTAPFERRYGRTPRYAEYGSWWLQACTDEYACTLVGSPLVYTGQLNEVFARAKEDFAGAPWVALLP